ncbi:diguanylate cyclase (GGDEF)-like protein [Robbsia andropogonis]|uniref:bifunctional diguanylate cyclase/phosphodiesterase n=1 Tax=Robbsia andropogonis TaxID=28092 RepID=UPI002A6AEC14|nr:EAL domain-containing protein [Robbsia andropogonis]
MLIRMPFHSLRARIGFTIVLLMLAVQIAGFLIISSVIRTNAYANANAELAVAERVLHEILDANGERLTQAASVVSDDFGFRAAVATHDVSTIDSALKNHGDRIHAKLAMLADTNGKLIADTAGPILPGEVFPFPDMIRQATREGSARMIGMLNGQLYQIVAVPVKAPLTIGYIGMGFAIDTTTAKEMAALLSLDVSFMARDGKKNWESLASSLDEPGAQDERGRRSDATRWDGGDRDYVSRLVRLNDTVTTAPMAVLLQRSLTDALQPFRRLQTALLLITVVGLVMSVLGSLLTANSVTKPIGALTRFSRRVGLGDYSEPIQIPHDSEVGQLAQAFNTMQEGISEREQRITELAYTDRLTRLPNRARFAERLDDALQPARAIERAQARAVSGIAPEHSGEAAAEASTIEALPPFSLMVMDLDRFKYVNDTLGHHIGDELLREAADRLRGALAPYTNMVARLGGDEFAILLPDTDSDAAIRVADLTLKTLEQPIYIEHQFVDVGASIGIATFPKDGTDASVLLRRADIAMYVAKRGNLGRMAFDDKYDKNRADRLSLMSELRQAVEQNELMLFYQPKVDLATSEVKYVEALVRWEHPVRGFVPPDQFIPFAEQTGYIKAITNWVIDRAVAQCAEWLSRDVELAISVNVSARDLIHSALPAKMATVLAKYKVPPHLVWLEITESAIIDDPAHAIATLDKLYALGIRLSIDDFGTGYSSLAYLKRMPVHELKIDRTFVMGMAEHVSDKTIVRSTIDLGHNMGLKVVAEGVENVEVMNQLRELNCDLAQGYHLSRPLPPERLEVWLAEWDAKLKAEAVVAAAVQAASNATSTQHVASAHAIAHRGAGNAAMAGVPRPDVDKT